MLLRFCNLCSKRLEPTFVNLERHYKTASNARVKQRASENEEPQEKDDKQLIIKCKRSEFNFYEGQTFSKRENIPIASKGWLHKDSRSDHFSIYPLAEAEENVDEKSDKIMSFDDFHLDPSVLDKLSQFDIREPLEIQRKGIPMIMDGYNVVLAAETGCGKTLAYLLPMIHHVLHWKRLFKRNFNCPLGLIITPTRELAVQIGLETQKLSRHLDIKTKIITGGKTKKLMLNFPLGDMDIVVSSFGVISKLTTNRIYSLEFVRHVVLDEADALFHDTFVDKVNVFMKRIPIGPVRDMDEYGFPTTAQLTLASATLPARMSEALHEVVDVDTLQCLSTKRLHHIIVPQKFIKLSPGQKPAALLKYIKPKVANKLPTIIFSNTNATSDWVSMFLNESGLKTVNLNGETPLKFRQGKYAEFRSGRCTILSTTNAGSRGLDTLMVNHILNYEFPLNTADYIHRCGRTGRVGTQGDSEVTNFISRPSEVSLVQKIERAARLMKPVPIINMGLKETEEEAFTPSGPPDTEETIEEIAEEPSIPY